MKKIISSWLVILMSAITVVAFSQPMNITDHSGNSPRTIAKQGVSGILSHERAVNPWVPIGPFGGDVYDIAVDPTDPDMLYAAAGFPYRSIDGGATWQVMESLYSQATNGISTVEVNNDGVVFAAGSSISKKVFRSDDHGETWVTKVLPVDAPPLDITIDPNDPNTVWLGMTSILGLTVNKVVLKSVNAGDSWTSFDLISLLPAGYSVINVVVDPSDSQILFAVAAEGFSNGDVVATFDGGATWQSRRGNLPTGIPYNRLTISGQNIFLAGGQLFGGQDMGVYKTIDEGLSWQEISGSFPNKVSNAVLVDPSDPLKMYVATEGDGIYYTADGGSTWVYNTPGAGDNGAARCLAFEPGNSQVIFAGFLSLAICKSMNSGQAWDYANTGIATLLTNDIEVNVNDPLKMLIGFEAENSGGCYLSNDGGATWSLVTGLPGTRFSQVKFGADNAMYAWSNGPSSIAQEGLYKSTDGGVTWSNKGPNVGSLFETQIFALDASAEDPNLIIIGGNNFGVNGWASVMHRTTNGGQTWDNVYTGPDNESFKFLFIDAGSNDQTIYSAYATNTDHGGFMKSTDQGTIWGFINNGLPSTAKWGGAIICSPFNSAILYGGLGGYGDMNAKIYKSYDAGSSWTPTSISLSSYSKFTDILISPTDSNIVYAATTMDGAYASKDAGLTWETAGDGLTATNISGFSHAFKVDDTWKMCASSFSNSAFMTDIYDVYASFPPVSSAAGHLTVMPNPGRGSCGLILQVDMNSHVEIDVYNSLGQKTRTVTDGHCEKGDHEYRYTGSAGLYYIRTIIDGIPETCKLVLY